jgi:hypothetical protein
MIAYIVLQRIEQDQATVTLIKRAVNLAVKDELGKPRLATIGYFR